MANLTHCITDALCYVLTFGMWKLSWLKSFVVFTFSVHECFILCHPVYSFSTEANNWVSIKKMSRCNFVMAVLEVSNSAFKSGNSHKNILKTFPKKSLESRVFSFTIVVFIVVWHRVANPTHLASK